MMAEENERPWGWYNILKEGERYKVKRISVKPGEAFSLQYHNNRKENWTIVRGSGKVTKCSLEEYENAKKGIGGIALSDLEMRVSSGDSVEIPIGTVHRFEADNGVVAEFIEVQTGDYLGEDDIVRLEDNYGRT